PPSTTLLADAFPHESRARLMSWWNFATPLGVFLGFAAGGLIGSSLGWCSAFYFPAIPGPLLAPLLARLPEPLRGASGRLRATTDIEPFLGAVVRLLRVRTLLFSIIAQALAFFVLGGVSFWIPYYLSQRYGMSTGTAGVTAGGVIVVGGALGTLAG